MVGTVKTKDELRTRVQDSLQTTKLVASNAVEYSVSIVQTSGNQ
jgi:hypothetical protein